MFRLRGINSGDLFNMELDAYCYSPFSTSTVPATPRPNHGDFSAKPPDVQKSTRIRSRDAARGIAANIAKLPELVCSAN
jgi:hypothetical protein